MAGSQLDRYTFEGLQEIIFLINRDKALRSALSDKAYDALVQAVSEYQLRCEPEN